MLYMVADNKCKTSVEDAARKILQDFRTGRMGNICLQLAPPLLYWLVATVNSYATPSSATAAAKAADASDIALIPTLYP